MGKSSGTNRPGGGIGRDGGGNFKGSIKNPESIANIRNTQLRREIQQGISKYESRLGVRQQNVQLAELSGALGVHVTAGGKSEAVYLDTDFYKNGTVAKVNATKQSAYKSGFLTKTNKPVQHTIVHELGHATWNNHLTGQKQLLSRCKKNKGLTLDQMNAIGEFINGPRAEVYVKDNGFRL